MDGQLGDRIEADAIPLDDRNAIPEHVVKDLLAELGVAVPRRFTADGTGAEQSGAAPLVLKAWGPGLLHKSDVGAVRLNLTPSEIDDAMRVMSEKLQTHGLSPKGFLVEEQHPGGVELIVGVVRDATSDISFSSASAASPPSFWISLRCGPAR
jgi:acyl-CoA synthetase (NDP forming)